MPTIFSHGIAAVSLSLLFGNKSNRIKFFLLVILCSCIPDIDVIAFKFGIPYAHWLGHRGISHSILFSFLFPIILLFLFYRKIKIFTFQCLFLWFIFFISTLSHPILDALTNGGLGVCLFCPFNTERFFFDYRPIQVSPIGKNFFSNAGLRVIYSEVIWIWIPSFSLLFLKISFKLITKLLKK